MITIFYADKVVTRLENWQQLSEWCRQESGREIYNGGYIHSPRNSPQWYRCDLTPVLLKDVPKKLRLAVLVLS